MLSYQEERELWQLIKKFSKSKEFRHTVSGSILLTEYYLDGDVLSIEEIDNLVSVSLNDCEIYGYIDVKSALENPPDEN